MSESDTPTVDALGVEAKDFILNRPYTKVIGIEHARTLERSLRTTQAELNAARAEIKAVTEQRDRLAEALKELERLGLRMVEIFDDSGDEITAKQFRRSIQAALQSLTTNTPDHERKSPSSDGLTK